jgi:hypothetical protein
MNNPYKELTYEEYQSCVSRASFQTGMAYDGRIPAGAVERATASNCESLIKAKRIKAELTNEKRES